MEWWVLQGNSQRLFHSDGGKNGDQDICKKGSSGHVELV